MQQQQKSGQDDDDQQQQQQQQEQQHQQQQPPISPIPVVTIEGVGILRIFENNRPLEEHVQMLKELEMRPDDVILMAYAKSGTHWTWEILSMLLSGKAEYEKRTKVFTMMETTRIEDLNLLPSPRILNSHLPFHLLPRRQIKDKRVKVVQVYRNVKDVLVSIYFHFRQNPGGADLTLEFMEKLFLSENVPTGNYFTYMKDMYMFRKNNPEVPFFLFSFEDTKENPEKMIQQLAKFLGLNPSPQLIKDIADVTNFAKMRHAEKNKQKTHLPPVEIFRKGEVGDWKNYLTVAQSERLEAAMTQLQSCDYHFRYEL